MSFHLDIVSLTGNLYSGEVDELSVPGSEGELVILAKHMPFVTSLTLGEVTVKNLKGTTLYTIGRGMLSVADNNATLMIEDVSSMRDITEEKALKAKQKAEELVEKGVSKEDLKLAGLALRRSLIDLKVARKQTRKTRGLN